MDSHLIGSAEGSSAAIGQEFNLTEDFYLDYGYYDNNVSNAGLGSEECAGAGLGAGLGGLRAGLYCAVLLVGVPGNLGLLGALWGRGRGWRTSEILAWNLAISDLLFLGALPLWIHSEGNEGAWAGGETSCKLAPYITALTMHVGVLLLTVMSIDRFVAVVHAGVYRRVRKRLWAGGSCGLCWLGGALLAVPVLQVRELQRDRLGGPARCGENEEQAGAYPPGLSLALLLLSFFLPLLLILACYSSLVRALRRHARGRGRGGASGSPASLRRALRMALFVGGAFLLCWLPFNAFKLLAALDRLLAPPPGCSGLGGVARAGMYWAAPLGFAHSCLNPLAYGAADRSLRQRALQGAAPCRWRRDRPGGGASSLTTPTSWAERESMGRDGKNRGREE
ncbi:G-protein coupled receptor 15-like [Conger conger]|uniref:G-protein coupled receptor 15-like n=1 Tax=Conger conger TaxID=82655 RepID=UPI002A5AAA28|nr:G-protein coupled receptor 15-like [Conger conger]